MVVFTCCDTSRAGFCSSSSEVKIASAVGFNEDFDDTVEVLFHDFFPLSPSYTLLDEDGRYRGAGAAQRDDKAHMSAC